MKITNRFNLTQAFVEAVTFDDYSKGDCDFSCTELISPPHLRLLERIHWDEIEEDAADRVWALLGTAVHVVLERTKGSEIKENRLYGVINVDGKNYTISAQMDNIDVRGGTITDYKITSAWGAVFGKDEWVQQLNIQDWICQQNGIDATSLQIQGIWKDWNRQKAVDDENYPQAPSTVIQIEQWSNEKTEEFIRERIRAHIKSPPDPCTDKERWYRPGKWAVMKKGNKRAVKLFDEGDQGAYNMVEELMKKRKPGERYSVEERPGTYARCNDYCSVNRFCKIFGG